MSFTKDPDAILDYQWDWTAWLAQESDVIVTSTFIVPTGINEGTGGKASSHTDTTATIWLSGGTAGSVYLVTNRIVTSGGRTNDRTTDFFVKDQ